MDKKTEALKLALEWDKRRKYIMPYVVRDAILEALAEQPAQQEPVARCMEHGECFGGECIYTSPPASKPLSCYINAAGINANDSPHIVVEKLERVMMGEGK